VRDALAKLTASLQILGHFLLIVSQRVRLPSEVWDLGDSSIRVKGWEYVINIDNLFVKEFETDANLCRVEDLLREIFLLEKGDNSSILLIAALFYCCMMYYCLVSEKRIALKMGLSCTATTTSPQRP
jgi:hypothetical protein